MLQENIKRLRTQKGLSQEELAARLNVVRQTISKWEKGLSVPDAQMLIQLAEVFEVSVSDLLGEAIDTPESKSELRLIADKLEQLNALLAERNARGKTVARIAAVCLIVAAAAVLTLELLPLAITAALLTGGETASIGIIGGADGPTSIMVASSGSAGAELVIGLVLAAAALTAGILLLRRARRK